MVNSYKRVTYPGRYITLRNVAKSLGKSEDRILPMPDRFERTSGEGQGSGRIG